MEWRLIGLLILMPVMLFMKSCQAEETITGEHKEFLTDSPPVDSAAPAYAAFTDDVSMKLANYFEPAVMDKLNQYVLAYNNLATAEDFEANYREGVALFSDLYAALTAPKTAYLQEKMDELREENEFVYPVDLLSDFESLNGLLGPIYISCAAECTDLDFLFDLQALKEKARSTTGNADDDFVDLVWFIEDDQYAYAAYPGFKVWYVPTWDYGGYSMLGNGVFSDAVKRTELFQKNHKLFSEEIKAIHADFFNSLTWDGSFGLSKEKVLEEFDALLRRNFFSKEEKEELKKQREKIENEEEGFQFDCETGDCTYG